MKSPKHTVGRVRSKPVKLLLHMAQVGDDWAGKAINISQNGEYQFCSLADLAAWLNQIDRK